MKHSELEIVVFTGINWKWCTKCFNGKWTKIHYTAEHFHGSGKQQQCQTPSSNNNYQANPYKGETPSIHPTYRGILQANITTFNNCELDFLYGWGTLSYLLSGHFFSFIKSNLYTSHRSLLLIIFDQNIFTFLLCFSSLHALIIHLTGSFPYHIINASNFICFLMCILPFISPIFHHPLLLRNLSSLLFFPIASLQ